LNVIDIVADVAGRLESLGIPYVIGGSLASSAWGEMRQTNYADIAILIKPSDVEGLISSFGDPFTISRANIEEALVSPDDFRSVQLTHMDEAFKIDLFLLRDGEYQRSELDRARSVGVGPNSVLRFAGPENIILAKLRWFVLGNRVSDRQWNDIVKVLEVQSGKLDNAYLNRWAGEFEVLDLSESARLQAC
jgi:hypothetical protein